VGGKTQETRPSRGEPNGRILRLLRKGKEKSANRLEIHGVDYLMERKCGNDAQEEEELDDDVSSGSRRGRRKSVRKSFPEGKGGVARAGGEVKIFC